MLAALEEQFGVTRPIDGIPMAGRTDRAITHDLFRYFDIEHHPEIWESFIAAYFRLLPQFLSQRDGMILPGIVTLIDALRDRGDIELGLLTGNFREGARLKLSHYDLYRHFEFGGYGDEHHDRDDVAREAFSVVKQRFDDVDPSRIWVIGDTPADIRCGRAIGANVVAVATGNFTTDELRPHQPNHLFADFSRPDEFLKVLV